MTNPLTWTTIAVVFAIVIGGLVYFLLSMITHTVNDLGLETPTAPRRRHGLGVLIDGARPHRRWDTDVPIEYATVRAFLSMYAPYLLPVAVATVTVDTIRHTMTTMADTEGVSVFIGVLNMSFVRAAAVRTGEVLLTTHPDASHACACTSSEGGTCHFIGVRTPSTCILTTTVPELSGLVREYTRKFVCTCADAVECMRAAAGVTGKGFVFPTCMYGWEPTTEAEAAIVYEFVGRGNIVLCELTGYPDTAVQASVLHDPHTPGPGTVEPPCIRALLDAVVIAVELATGPIVEVPCSAINGHTLAPAPVRYARLQIRRADTGSRVMWNTADATSYEVTWVMEKNPRVL